MTDKCTYALPGNRYLIDTAENAEKSLLRANEMLEKGFLTSAEHTMVRVKAEHVIKQNPK